MQNLQLPHIPVQETFYLRQLSVYVFCIHDIKKNKAKLYVYHEGQAKKGPDEVCSFLSDFLSDVPDSVKNLHVYSDNCGGQNKNHTLMRYLLSLTDSGRFENITYFFPMKGHSFLPCDRDFSTMKKSFKKKDCIYSITEINEIIVNSSNSRKFEVKEINGLDIIDFKTWWPIFYKKKMLCLTKQIQKVSIETKKLLLQYQNSINSTLQRIRRVKSKHSHSCMDFKFRHSS